MGFTRIEKTGGAIRVVESELDGSELNSYILPSVNSITGRDISSKYTIANNANIIRNVWDNEAQSRLNQEGATFADIQNQQARYTPVGRQAPDTSQWNIPWEVTGNENVPDWLKNRGDLISGTYTAGTSGSPNGDTDTTSGSPNGDTDPNNNPDENNNGSPLPTQGTGVIDSGGRPVNQGGAQVSYAQTPWAYIYGDFINQTVGLGGNPAIYQHMRSEGLSNDPLKRTIFTQFLLDGTYGDTNRQALYGIAPGTELPVDHVENYAIGEGNPYADYLKSYRAFTPGRTVGLIYDVIDALKNDRVWQSGAEFTPQQIREFRWEERFGTSPNAIQNQQALAALPIMRATPALLQDETSRILNMLYQRWQADPDKDDNIGWLEHVYKNKFFGLAGDIGEHWSPITAAAMSHAAEQGVAPADTSQPGWTPESTEKVSDEESTNPITKESGEQQGKTFTDIQKEVGNQALIDSIKADMLRTPEANTEAISGQEGLTGPDIQEKIALYNEFGTPWTDFGDPEGRTETDFMLKYQTSKEQEAAFQRSKQFMEFDDRGAGIEDRLQRRRVERNIPIPGEDHIIYDFYANRRRFEDWVNR